MLGTPTVTGTTFSFDATVGEGTHSLTAQATNAAGNTATSTTPVTFIVDRTPPTLVMNSVIDGNGNPVPNNGITTSDSITFTFTASDNPGGAGIDKMSCSTGGWDLHPAYVCTSPQTFSHLTEGPWKFQVIPMDTAGNAIPDWSMVPPYFWIWIINNAPPTIIGTYPADGATGVPVALSWL